VNETAWKPAETSEMKLQSLGLEALLEIASREHDDATMYTQAIQEFEHLQAMIKTLRLSQAELIEKLDTHTLPEAA
jgi:hypothetical protein